MTLPAQTSGPLRTPKEWVALKHPNETVWDPDGWRGPRGRSFTDPIDEAEFDWRYVQCTVGPRRERTSDAPEQADGDSPTTEEYMAARGAMLNPDLWEKDERACGCVFWTFNSPQTDTIPPWEALRYG